MWKIGDYVQHGTDGVCRITDIRKLNLTGEGVKEYFILEPLYAKDTTIYLETKDGDEGLTKPMNRREINALIRKIPENRMHWIANEKDRQNRLGAILKNGSILEVMCAASTLYRKKKEQEKAGRKFRRSDEQCLSRAEKIIGRELAYGIGRTPEEVPAYIGEVLEETIA